jgi:4-amino-4-deoxy-L-arabinose transferase-like glycosyltransferase
MDRRILFILFLILLVGTFLRLRSLDEDLLWQDEAEVAIYARQIVSGGFPNEYYRGIQVYVSPLIPEKVDSVMYEYKQRDFRDGLAVYHPPADAYLTALSFFLLGTSTFAARLPFALLGIASLFLIYQLGKFLYNTRIGLFACILQATSVLLILFERQSRYYSLSVFGFLAMLYFSLKAFRTGTMLYYAASSLSFVLLFYTQPIIAIIAITSLVFYNIYIGKYKILFSKKYILSLATSLSLLTPYLIIIRPWEISGSYLGSFEISKLLILPFFINEVIYNVGSMALLISAIFNFKLADLHYNNFIINSLFFVLSKNIHPNVTYFLYCNSSYG